MYVHTRARSRGDKQGTLAIGSLGTGIIGGCEPLRMGTGNGTLNSGFISLATHLAFYVGAKYSNSKDLVPEPSSPQSRPVLIQSFTGLSSTALELTA